MRPAASRSRTRRRAPPARRSGGDTRAAARAEAASAAGSARPCAAAGRCDSSGERQGVVLADRPCERDRSLAERHDALGVALDLVGVLGDEHERDAGLALSVEALPETPPL